MKRIKKKKRKKREKQKDKTKLERRVGFSFWGFWRRMRGEKKEIEIYQEAI